MIIAGQLKLESWNNKPDKDWTWSDWTRLKCGELELSNCIEFTDWERDPLEPIVCTICGTSGCGPSHLIHLVRTENQLLWMRPYESDRYWVEAELESHSIADTLMIHRADWDEIAQQSHHLPKFESIRRISSRDLLELWRQQLPPCIKPRNGDSYPRHFLMNCIASHPRELDDAMQLAFPLLEGNFGSDSPLAGEFLEVHSADERVQTFYFDAEPFTEWRAFLCEPPHQLVIANRWLLQPLQPPIDGTGSALE